MKQESLITVIGLMISAVVLFHLLPVIAPTGYSGTESALAQEHQPSMPGMPEMSGPAAKPQPTTPKSEAGGGEVPAIQIPMEKQQLIGVKTVPVSIRPLQKIIRTVGRIEYDEKRLATVNTKFEGYMEKLYVDYTGRYVRKGEPLAEIYSPELFATQQEFLNLLKWSKTPKTDSVGTMLSKDAETILEAAKQRLRLWDITDDQIANIAATEKPIRRLTIYSPATGYVIQKTAILGMRVMPGEKLFDIGDLSRVWIIADIYEYELSLVKRGDTAAIQLSYLPGKEYLSKIDYIYPDLSGETRTAKVRFSIPNPEGQLKPQMYTNVEVKIPLGEKLAIPEDAVIDTGVRQIVYVDRGDGYFQPREVLIGVQAEGMVQVLKGLQSGERVVSAATFLIDSEAKLKGVAAPGDHEP